ncbi:uncharacterized protein BO80DRAFT_411736 [Aspergillus ibericus CBS 121593]|uniref:Uncharacterized protein n=1 Tax=Aspergillus ibericus CBS 121593 TaxID=1448316 RepID=A0A395GTD9_9EURO|nr:hypothetical protein BO80DRAFT_411736 [Aspergillus ibericus CBS 121593]RAK98709.1 hypothetical protein BO80DRAFT_411736 [Aspergillus ibericus CBS 121593]
MTYHEVPNSIRITLIILTILSFTPQLHTLYTTKSSTGISIGYILSHLLVATEHLTKLTYMMINVPEAAAGQFIHDPINPGDWLNFLQTLTTWILFLTLFITSLYLRPPSHNPRPYITTYTLILLISLLPELIDPFLRFPHEGYQEAFVATHTILLSPIATFLAGFAVCLQAGQSKIHGTDSALSMTGLAAQAVVFGLVAASWPFRIAYREAWDPLHLGAYFGHAWAGVDYGVLGVVQGVLVLWVGWRRWRGVDGDGVGDGVEEREALLGRA